MSTWDPTGFLEGMANAPEGQMDAAMIPRFRALAENKDRKAADLLKIMDECVYAGLCSDFCILVMDKAWESMLKNEGKTREQGFAEATWRKDRV